MDSQARPLSAELGLSFGHDDEAGQWSLPSTPRGSTPGSPGGLGQSKSNQPARARFRAHSQSMQQLSSHQPSLSAFRRNRPASSVRYSHLNNGMRHANATGAGELMRASVHAGGVGIVTSHSQHQTHSAGNSPNSRSYSPSVPHGDQPHLRNSLSSNPDDLPVPDVRPAAISDRPGNYGSGIATASTADLEARILALTSGSGSSGPTPYESYFMQMVRDPVDEMLMSYSLNRSMPQRVGRKREAKARGLESLEMAREVQQAAQEAFHKDVSPPRAMSPRLEDVRSRVKPRSPDAVPASYSARFKDSADAASAAADSVPRCKVPVPPPVQRFATAEVMRSDPRLGAYLASPAYSFAATVPIKTDGGNGVMFEKYSVRPESDTLPQLQHYYIRPNRATTMPRPTISHGSGGSSSPPPTRMLPNGIPMARLEHLKTMQDAATKKSKSFQQQEKAKAEQRVLAAIAAMAGPTIKKTAAEAVSAGPKDLETAISALANGNVTLQRGSAEPVLDEALYGALTSHFSNMASSQTQKLQQKLNSNLPAIMEGFGCVLR